MGTALQSEKVSTVEGTESSEWSDSRRDLLYSTENNWSMEVVNWALREFPRKDVEYDGKKCSTEPKP
jgi:hypothetical protein